MLKRLTAPAHLLFVALLALLPAGCDPEPELDTLTVAGDQSFLHAGVEIDGDVVGQLQPLDGPGTLFRALLPTAAADSPLTRMVALNVPIDRSRMPHGQHTVRLTRAGQPAFTASFRYPFAGPERHCLLLARGSTFLVSDSCAPGHSTPAVPTVAPLATGPWSTGILAYARPPNPACSGLRFARR